jgi:CIC family chloride channel protein
MAALFAGATQAPLNIMIMIPEMSNDLSLLPPVMASSGISFAVSWFFLRGASIYTLKLQKRGLDLRMGESLCMDASWVEDVMTDVVINVDSDMSLKALEALYASHPHEGYPVVKAERFVEMVMAADLKKAFRESKERVKVEDLVSKETLFVHPHETVQSALNKMNEHRRGLLPVLDRHDPSRLVGVVTRGDLYRVFGREAAG